MLVRCEKCLTVYPAREEKCPKCKSQDALPTIRVPVKRPRTAAWIAALMVAFTMIFLVIAIYSIITNNYEGWQTFIRLSAICAVISAISVRTHNKTLEKRTNHAQSIQGAEYEQRIRDFINQERGKRK